MRCWPRWDTTCNGLGEGGAGSLPPGQSESEVWKEKISNPLPTFHLEIEDVDTLLPLRADPVVKGNLHNFRCKGFGHFTREYPSEGFYKVGANGLPIRVRDPSHDSSQDSRQAKDNATAKPPLN